MGDAATLAIDEHERNHSATHMRPTADNFARSAARRLRRTPSEAEAALWHALRRGRAGELRFRRQVPIDRYIADFACLRERLVVEVDGSQHVEQATYDAERTKRLESLEFHVLRFWANDVLRDPRQIVEAIWTAVLDLRSERAGRTHTTNDRAG